MSFGQFEKNLFKCRWILMVWRFLNWTLWGREIYCLIFDLIYLKSALHKWNSKRFTIVTERRHRLPIELMCPADNQRWNRGAKSDTEEREHQKEMWCMNQNLFFFCSSQILPFDPSMFMLVSYGPITDHTAIECTKVFSVIKSVYFLLFIVIIIPHTSKHTSFI